MTGADAVGPRREGNGGTGWRARWAAVLILAAHAGVLGASLPRNAVTLDEVDHLPAGVCYWRRGEFWAYHHNPPLIRLLVSLPAVVSGVPGGGSHVRYVPGARWPDGVLGRDFLRVNRGRYLEVFVRCRWVVVALSVLGGAIVFAWSRRLFGGEGGLLSLGLWCACPNVLAHGGLATTDLGATVVGLAASFAFAGYLARPGVGRAVWAGVWLGLAVASKFTFVILPAVWAALAALRWAWGGARRASAWPVAAAVLAALVMVNDVYLFEGSGQLLGSFGFRSRLLAGGAPPGGNRFRGTWLGGLPVPLPRHFVLGFDDQAYDVDTFGYDKYLRGELRAGVPGWWHYYGYAVLVKTPLGTLTLLTLAALAFATRRAARASPWDEAALLVPPLCLFLLISSQRGINSHLRYVLPAYPFAFVAAGRLGRGATAGARGWARRGVVLAAVACSAASVAAVHPHYLTYFNEAVGGPDRGLDHLAESNLDWGQGLVALRDWLEGHARGRPLHLAYYGRMDPDVLGIAFRLPPFGPGLRSPGAAEPGDGPIPGLHAVSANFLVGLPFRAHDGRGSTTEVPRYAYTYFRRLRPVAVAGHSIWVFDLTREQADRARRELGLPSLAGPRQPPPGEGPPGGRAAPVSY